MHLGDRIYTLRTAKGLSQSDLADALEVSRQSVSKWETNTSVPDLEKLVKMSAFFGISLDELVTGEGASKETEEKTMAEPPQTVVIRTAKTPARKIVGWILLIVGAALALSGGPWAMLLALPFVVLGTVCLLAKRHTTYWSVWTAVVLLDGYLQMTTGIRWTLVFWTLDYAQDMNYMRLATGWGMLLWRLAFIILTVFLFSREERTPHGWIYVLTGLAILGLLIPVAQYITASGAFVILGWIKLAAVTALLTALFRWLRERKNPIASEQDDPL